MFWAKSRAHKVVHAGIVDIYPRLHRYCLVLTADPNLADDLAQAGCTRALERADQFKQGSHLDRWIFTITQRLWIDERRKQAVRTGSGLLNINDVDIADGSLNPEATLMNREVIYGVMKLPEVQRITVLLVYAEGYSYKDAAHILDIPIGTVMSRLAAARGKLVATFKDHLEVE